MVRKPTRADREELVQAMDGQPVSTSGFLNLIHSMMKSKTLADLGVRTLSQLFDRYPATFIGFRREGNWIHPPSLENRGNPRRTISSFEVNIDTKSTLPKGVRPLYIALAKQNPTQPMTARQLAEASGTSEANVNMVISSARHGDWFKSKGRPRRILPSQLGQREYLGLRQSYSCFACSGPIPLESPNQLVTKLEHDSFGEMKVGLCCLECSSGVQKVGVVNWVKEHHSSRLECVEEALTEIGEEGWESTPRTENVPNISTINSVSPPNSSPKKSDSIPITTKVEVIDEKRDEKKGPLSSLELLTRLSQRLEDWLNEEGWTLTALQLGHASAGGISMELCAQKDN